MIRFLKVMLLVAKKAWKRPTTNTEFEFDARKNNARQELTELMAKLTKNAEAEAEGKSQEERRRIADASLGAFLMGGQAVAIKYGLSKSELDVLLLAAHNLMPPKV